METVQRKRKKLALLWVGIEQEYRYQRAYLSNLEKNVLLLFLMKIVLIV